MINSLDHDIKSINNIDFSMDFLYIFVMYMQYDLIRSI